jgi:uncharacterized protein (TIGR01777 family)
MRVVVAGSSGLRGSRLVQDLREAGHEVIRLVRRTPKARDERGWDPPAGRIDDGALDGADAVVNLNGNSQQPRHWSGAYKQALRDSRIVPTEVLAAAVAEHRIPALVNASGINYYGDTGSTAVDETAPPGRGFMADLTKDWEAATTAAADVGARVVRLRTGLVLSPRGGLLGPLRPLFLVGLGGKLGSGRQYMSWISLDDDARAIRFAVEHDTLSGPVNLVGPEPVTNIEFTRSLATALHRPAVFTAPGFGLRLVLGDAADELALISIRVVARVLDEAGFEFRHRTIDEAFGAVVSG